MQRGLISFSRGETQQWWPGHGCGLDGLDRWGVSQGVTDLGGPLPSVPSQRLAQAPQDSWAQAFPALVHRTPGGVISLPSPEAAGSKLSRVARVRGSPNLCDSRGGGVLGAALPCGETYGSTCEGLCVLGEGRVCRREDKGFPCPPPPPPHRRGPERRRPYSLTLSN